MCELCFRETLCVSLWQAWGVYVWFINEWINAWMMNKVSALDISLLSFTLCSFYWRTKKQWHELPLSLKWALVHHPLKKKKKIDSSLHVSYISNSPSHSRSCGSDSVSSSCGSKGDHPQTDTHGWREDIGGLVSRRQQTCRKCVGLHVAFGPLCIPKITCMWCLFIVPGALPASTHERTPSHMQFAGDV